MADQIENLVVTTKGAGDLQALTARARETEQAIADLKLSFDRGTVQGPVYRAELKQLEREYGSLQKQIEKLGGGGPGGFKSMGSAGLQASYAFQDLVSMNGDLLRGFMAIQNNVPQLVMSLGGSMGLAGAIGAVGVMASIAVPHVEGFIKALSTGAKPEWRDEFLKSLGQQDIENFTDTIDKLRKRIDEIEKKPLKLAIDYTELETAKQKAQQLQDGLKALEEWKKQHTDWEQKSGAAVREIMSKAPANIADTLVKQEFQTLKDANADVLRELEQRVADAKTKIRAANRLPQGDYEKDVLFSAGQKELREAMAIRDPLIARLKETAGTNIGTMRKGAEAGDQESQKQLAERLRQTGKGLLAHRIEGASVEQLKVQEEVAAKMKLSVELSEKNKAEEDRRKADALIYKQYGKPALEDWEKLSPKRQEVFRRGGGTEAQMFGRFAADRATRIEAEMANPEPPRTTLEELARIPDLDTRLRQMTPSERAAYERKRDEENRKSAPPYQPLSPEALAGERAAQQIIRARRAAEESAADASVAPGMFMGEAARNADAMGGPAGGAGQLVQQAASSQNELVQRLMEDNAMMRAYLQQLAAENRQYAGNFNGMNMSLQSTGNNRLGP